MSNNISNIRRRLNNVATKLENMQRNYDSEGFANQLENWISELEFFYNRLVPRQNNDPSRTFYKIPPAKRPSEGQIAYFNLRRGYPKEVFDGHYCYIVKDFGIKYIVVPTTSVKDNSKPDPRFEFDIDIENFINDAQTRLQISDIRSVDAQRINESKGVFDVATNRKTILKAIKKITCS